MNDLNYVDSVFVAKNCARTSGGPENIDGVAVSGVQVITSKIDTGAPATTYYGPGELVITDESGLVLDAVSANDKTIPAIKISHRSFDGLNFHNTKALEGKNVTNFTVEKYLAPSECVVALDAIDDSLADYSYTLKIRKIQTDKPTWEEAPVVKSFVFRTAIAGNTDLEIVAGLVAQINAKLNPDKDEDLHIEAFANGAGDGFVIRALPKPFEVGKFSYDKYMFTIDLNFDATIVTNLGQDIIFDAVPYLAFTEGAGTYGQVLEMEWSAKGVDGANKDKMRMQHVANMIAYNTQKYEDDGITDNRYDVLNIAWEGDYGQLGRAFQKGNVMIALPVDDNVANQQTEILDTLVAYFITAYGLGVPTPTLT